MNICLKVYVASLLMSFCVLLQPLRAGNDFFLADKYPEIQDEKLNNFIFSENIKTVRIFPEGWELGYPVIDLKGDIPLVFSFDDLTDESQNYSYTIIHCGSNWIPSDILQSDYISGFPEAIINQYEFSRNTFRDYIHYTLKIPNEDMKPTLPGNYILMVYENFDRSRPLITTRFYVVDYLVKIEGSAKRSEDMAYFNTGQEVDFNIHLENLKLDDPDRNIGVCITQNNNSLTGIANLSPTYVQNNMLIYNYEEENHFDGLSEFRYFDTKNLKYITNQLDRVVFQRPYHHAYLLPDPVRSLGDYDFYEDLNGNFFIKWDEGKDSRIDADYIIMHFSLPFDAPLPGADVYLYGGLTHWSLLPEMKMEYNLVTRAYELESPFKQGIYDYQYVFVHNNGEVDFTLFEGSHFETENDYLVFVYYKDFRKRYESLVGFKIFNTIEKSKF